MFFQIKKVRGVFIVSLAVMIAGGFFLGECYAASKVTNRTSVTKKRRRGAGGNYSPVTTDLYKGESPCKIGDGILYGVNSKFCGFYDYKADMEAKETEEKD
jgi:hypothetical protein